MASASAMGARVDERWQVDETARIRIARL